MARKTKKIGPEGLTMSEYTIAADVGNGTSVVMRTKNGKLQTCVNPHGRIEISPTIRVDKSKYIETTQFKAVEWKQLNGDVSIYAYGEGIEEATGKTVESYRNSVDRYGSEHQIFSLITSIHEMGVPDDQPLSILMTVPPSYMRYIDEIREMILSRTWEIKDYRKRDKWKSYKVERISFLPEGLPAFEAYVYDKNGQCPLSEREIEVLDGRVSVIDLGNGTMNTLRLAGGLVIEEALARGTNSHGGIQKRIIEPLMAMIHEMNQSSAITEATIDSIIREWSKAGMNYEPTIRINGRDYSIGDQLRKLIDAYANWLIQEPIAKALNDGVDAFVTVGGGWYLVYDKIKKYHQGTTFVKPGDYPHLNGVDWTMLNAYGTLVKMVRLIEKERGNA